MKLIINTLREGYSTEQVRNTITAGELIELMQKYNENTPIYLSFDDGYTYGGIKEDWIEEKE